MRIRYLLATAVALGSRPDLVFSRASIPFTGEDVLEPRKDHGGQVVPWDLLLKALPARPVLGARTRPGRIQFSERAFLMTSSTLGPGRMRLPDLLRPSSEQAATNRRCHSTARTLFQSRTCTRTESP